MKQIGIVDLEISIKAYNIMNTLPEGIRFYLRLEPFDKISDYANGIYKYIIPHSNNIEKCVSSFQINDIKEVGLLRPYSNLDHVKIVGLDDLMCNNYAYVMNEIRTIFDGKTINFCPENTFDCASALCILWLTSGGKEVTTSFAGVGGLAATEEVYMGMHVISRYKANQSLVVLENLTDWYEEITGNKISSIKPIIGKTIFHVESGIHVDGILKNPSNYEAYKPELVGKETTIVIGKHSGSNSIKLKCKEYGIKITDMSKINCILEKIKLLSMEKRRGLSDDEFLKVVYEVLANERKKMDS
ncbi:MAG: hypothetical protein AB7E42_09420 [Anaerotignaceae bacterium]